jgi:hypothetical protein
MEQCLLRIHSLHRGRPCHVIAVTTVTGEPGLITRIVRSVSNQASVTSVKISLRRRANQPRYFFDKCKCYCFSSTDNEKQKQNDSFAHFLLITNRLPYSSIATCLHSGVPRAICPSTCFLVFFKPSKIIFRQPKGGPWPPGPPPQYATVPA